MKELSLAEYVDRLEGMLDRHRKVCGQEARCPVRPHYRLGNYKNYLKYCTPAICNMCKRFVGLATGGCPCSRTSSKQTARERARKAIAKYRKEHK